MNFDRIQSKMDDAFQELMEEEGIEQITDEQARNWPLDNRARPRIMFSNGEVLCVPANDVRSLDYYGGFEYIDSIDRMQIGNWVVFSNESDRVAEVINAMLNIETSDEAE